MRSIVAQKKQARRVERHRVARKAKRARVAHAKQLGEAFPKGELPPRPRVDPVAIEVIEQRKQAARMRDALPAIRRRLVRELGGHDAFELGYEPGAMVATLTFKGSNAQYWLHVSATGKPVVTIVARRGGVPCEWGAFMPAVAAKLEQAAAEARASAKTNGFGTPAGMGDRAAAGGDNGA